MRRIIADPAILGGKPVVEGTRVSVEQILGLLANGMSVDDICESYPLLSQDDIRTVLRWAQAALRNDIVVDVA